MTSTHPCEVRMIRTGASQVAHALARSDLSLTSRLECIQQQHDPDLIGHVIQLVNTQADLQSARLFLPALHAHQIALWFEQ